MTGKTLKELNVQVGDVVKSVYTGFTYVVRVVDMNNAPDWDVAKWEIASRAKKYTEWQFTDAPENAETHTMPDGSIAWRVDVKPVKTYHPIRIEHSGYVGYTTITAIDGKPQSVSIEWDALT